MRLLESSDGKFKLTKDLVHNLPRYAILSHTWGPDTEEVTFRDLMDGTGANKTGYEKIQFCEAQARRDGLRYFWVDTCCIDKSNNNELATAINSMFRYYQNAARCYVYLPDTSASGYEDDSQQSEPVWEQAFRASKWFTRGWTLQELLAPASVEFFTKEGRRLGDKRSLEQQIHEITGIAVSALRGSVLAQFDVDERFKWAQMRQTTHQEDSVYCLLGIFGIFMPLIYGEGKAHAVRRLKKEIAEAAASAKAVQTEISPMDVVRRKEPTIQDVMRAKASEDCLQSLAFPEMQNRFHDIGRATMGTCEWLFRHETYRRWTACDRGLLWIKGKPGSGKSTLLKYALDNHQTGDNALILSFLFHGRGDELQKTPLGLFRSLLHQVLKKVPDALLDLVDTFGKKCKEIGRPGEKWQWHLEELQRFFQLCLPKVLTTRSVWLFIDALDECGKVNAVKLVRKFRSLLKDPLSASIGLSQFRICFACRPYPILDLDDNFELCLEEENGKDISTFVNDQLSEFRVRKSSMIPALITESAFGVFMWAGLVVKRVLDLELEGRGLKAIEDAIRTIPTELDELYKELIRGMESASLKLIQWICFATRPLSINELRWAMIIEADCSYKSFRECNSVGDYASDSNGMKRLVQTLSCGLAEVTPSLATPVVQFIHQSVKDFFVSERGLLTLDNRSTSIDLAIGMAHFRLSRICIRYLAMKEIHRSTSYSRDDFPFLHYATTSWVAHTKQSDARGVPQQDLLGLFSWPSYALVELWVRVYRGMDKYSIDCPQRGTNLIHVMSRYQVVGPLMAALQRAGQITTDIDAMDEYGRTPLSYAAQSGHEVVVKLLLDTGKVNVNANDRFTFEEWTPMCYAAGNGHEAVVKLLLDTGKVDINAKNSFGWTPLSLAAANGHKAVVKLMLDKGKADVDAKNGFGRTPMWYAAANGHEAVVKLLLDTGKVDIGTENYHDKPPLLWAAKNKHEAVIKLLLDTGKVDINAKNSFGWTPLLWAAENRHEAFVKLLLDTGKADVNAKDRSGRTPLSYAAANGHKAVVKLLLDTSKVDIDAKYRSRRTPLSYAAGNGHKAVVKLLLDTGKADVDIKDRSGRTPLSYAAANGHEAVVKLLFDVGKVNVDAKDRSGRTPLSYAAANGHEAVVKLLFDTGKVNVDAKDRSGRTPLSCAAANGHKTIIKLLYNTSEVEKI